MNPLSLLNLIPKPYLYLGIATIFISSCLYTYKLGISNQKIKQAAAELVIERNMAAVLAKKSAEVAALNAKHQALAIKLELDHAQAVSKIDGVLARNKLLIKQLRDPGKNTNCNSTLSSAGSATDKSANSTANGFLSTEATGFLLEFSASCDRTAAYARTCYNWIKQRQPLR